MKKLTLNQLSKPIILVAFFLILTQKIPKLG